MKNRKLKKIVTIAFAFVLLCTGFQTQAAEEQIKISDKEYAIVLNDAANAFIGNKIPMSGVVGTKVFLTYTVHKVNSNFATQDGVIATNNAAAKWPSSEGCQIWSSGTRLFQEGYTYIFRLERTEEGFTYQALKMKDDKVANIQFTKGEATNDKFPYYGIWTGGTSKHTVNAVLSHVRCYDENGNDLGLKSNLDPSKVKIYEDGEVEDYATVEGGYYCEENNTLLVLNDQKVAYKDSGAEGKEVSYKVAYEVLRNTVYYATNTMLNRHPIFRVGGASSYVGVSVPAMMYTKNPADRMTAEDVWTEMMRILEMKYENDWLFNIK